MRRALAFTIFVLCMNQAYAGDKKPMTPERVGQLLTILRSDLSEENRTHAAEELGRLDASRYPEIIPLLIETLRTDPKPAVRAEVVDSLAKIRPLTREAAKALDAAKEDGSFKVRWHARNAVRAYHNAGYQEQETKVAVSGSPSVQTTTKVVEAPSSPQSGGWLSNLIHKPAQTPAQPVVSKPVPPVKAPESSQSGGWLYNMVAKPNSTAKAPKPTSEPPLAPTDGAIIRTTPESGNFPVTTNPFADIQSAPAAPATRAQPPAPPAPQTPVIPVLPSKPGRSGTNLLPD
jgi:hypothetical protein